jgi:hypothetical protein
MTDARVLRLYVFAVALLVFFVTWAVVAARPWAQRRASADPAVAALALREGRIHDLSLLVQRIQTQRARQGAAAPPPAPRVVTLPPLVVTRTS